MIYHRLSTLYLNISRLIFALRARAPADTLNVELFVVASCRRITQCTRTFELRVRGLTGCVDGSERVMAYSTDIVSVQQTAVSGT